MKLTREEARETLGVGVRAGPHVPNAGRHDQLSPCSPEGSVRARVPWLEAAAPALCVLAA